MKDEKQLAKFREKIARIKDEATISHCLQKTSKEYRSYDPGWYLYRKLNEENKRRDIFSDDYLELVYVTLCSWNMNQRAAKLANFEDFKRIIRESRSTILSLKGYKIENIKDLDNVLKAIEVLFHNLRNICHQESKIVTFSKCLHFMLPHLIVPVDRKYTMMFFQNNVMIPKGIQKQLQLYKTLFLCCHDLTICFDLTKYLGDRWNENIPKVIDNIIIGYQKIHS